MKNIIALLRIGMGWIFFWAFLDKMFGLGFATLAENAWIVGGSPTEGFLKFATKGPFAEIFQSLAGSGLVDSLFMIGLLMIGIGLMFGVWIRLASYFGVLMLALMYLAGSIPLEHNPFIDDHVMYAILMFAFPLSDNSVIGISRWWRKTNLVKKYPILK